MESIGDILAKSKGLRKLREAATPLTRAQEQLLDVAMEIRLNPAEVEKTFLARELVQCTLPHSNPRGNPLAWSRSNGTFTLGIVPGVNIETGKSYGYPYGAIPRLVLFWITTEAVRNLAKLNRGEISNARRLDLGHSLAQFMRDLGLDPNTGGGKRSDARRLQNQMQRLFKATISFQRTVIEAHRQGNRWRDMQVAPEGELWWDAKQPGQAALWGSWIELGDKFFEAITAAPVPADMRVLRAIKRSPLALDLYAWATWRVFRLQKATFIPWTGLMLQIGAEYTNAKDFGQKAKGAFRKICALYPGLKIEWRTGGFTLHPSPTSVPALPAAAAQKRLAQ
jgi:hypothetical protein